MNNNIIPHNLKVSREMREKLNSHSGAVIWLTGLSGSGKSTIANELELNLYSMNMHTYTLDGDNIRSGLNSDLGFSEKDRNENIRRIGEVSFLLADAGLITLTAFISPFRKDRDFVRSLLPEGRFIEVYVKCPLDIAEKRDPKGLYKKARAGEIKEFTGITSPYEEPLDPEITVDTSKQNLSECIVKITGYLKEKYGSHNPA